MRVLRRLGGGRVGGVGVCKWCNRKLDTRREYCNADCNAEWKRYLSSASENPEQLDARLRAHLAAAGDAAIQEGNGELLVKIRRELRQPFKRAAEVTAEDAKPGGKIEDPLSEFA